MSIDPLTDDPTVTLTWHTTTVEEHTRTFTFRDLRDAIKSECRHERWTQSPDIADDLDALEQRWLGEHEDDGSLVEFTRNIEDHTLPRLPVFTVTIAGPERHDGEAPFTYCLHAADLDTARTLALAHHLEAEQVPGDGDASGPDVHVIEGARNTFAGGPPWPADLPGRAWNDLREDADMVERAYRAAITR